ncbi:GNAT family N-acetyltransferase [Brevibacterium casei]|uniref:GNAT family N-acetyltransferase n=1 Tax=Brevibacterium casei TaxID=33889 RepID=UPI00241E1D8B|nr:GNAT family N-acetyltransferase [Brevibacterium casei]
MEITHIPAGTLPESEIEDTVAEVVAFDRVVNSASGLGPDFDPRSAEVRRQLQRTNDYTTHALWLGRLGGDIVAKGIAYLDLQDNQNAAEIHVAVHPEHRRQGLGSELLAVMEEQLAGEGRRTLTSFAETPAGVVDREPRTARIAAASGTGRCPRPCRRSPSPGPTGTLCASSNAARSRGSARSGTTWSAGERSPPTAMRSSRGPDPPPRSTSRRSPSSSGGCRRTRPGPLTSRRRSFGTPTGSARTTPTGRPPANG